jgi:hypothetical protein
VKKLDIYLEIIKIPLKGTRQNGEVGLKEKDG